MKTEIINQNHPEYKRLSAKIESKHRISTPKSEREHRDSEFNKGILSTLKSVIALPCVETVAGISSEGYARIKATLRNGYTVYIIHEHMGSICGGRYEVHATSCHARSIQEIAITGSYFIKELLEIVVIIGKLGKGE
jgi:hypothetical protein